MQIVRIVCGGLLEDKIFVVCLSAGDEIYEVPGRADGMGLDVICTYFPFSYTS